MWSGSSREPAHPAPFAMTLANFGQGETLMAAGPHIRSCGPQLQLIRTRLLVRSNWEIQVPYRSDSNMRKRKRKSQSVWK